MRVAGAGALSLALRACPSPELQGRDGPEASVRLLHVERRVAGGWRMSEK